MNLETATTPWSGVSAVLRSIFSALHAQSAWLAWIYALFISAGLGCLLLMNRVSEDDIPAGLPGRALLIRVLEKAHDQAARFLATFTVSFFVFSFSLSLRGTGAEMQSMIWLRAFPSLGFAVLQMYSVYRWYVFFKREVDF